MGRNILSICDECEVYVFHLRGKESRLMQQFQNLHSDHEKQTRIVSDYVVEQPEHYIDVTDDLEDTVMSNNTPRGLVSKEDAQMDTELFELCKEVYSRFPEWNGTEVVGSDDGEQFIFEDAKYWLKHGNGMFPLYTSDYLLEKLPESTHKFGDFGVSRGYSKGEPAWRFYFQKEYGNLVMDDEQVEGIADTPLKALLKLTIALHDSGALK